MTDYTDAIVAEREKELIDQSSGVRKANAFRAKKQKIDDDKIVAAQSVAYDGANLGAVGPKEDEYDYDGAYREGNTFKTDDSGGVTLKNKNFKAGQIHVGGMDVNTGERLAGNWEDVDGDFEKGRKILSDGEYNTQDGSSYKQTDGLFSVANGVIKNGGRFEDYMNTIQGPWNHDQIAMGWNAAETAHRTMNDIDTQGKRYYDEMREDWDQYEGVIAAIPATGFTEETLAADKDWIAGGRKIGDFLFGPESNAQKSDEEIGHATKTLVSQFRNNFDLNMWWADRVVQENDPELARAWLALDAQYDAMEIGADSFGRAAAAQLNMTNLVTFGGGILVTTLGKFAAKEGVKQAMKRVVAVAGVEAGISGGMGAAENVGRQKVEMSADVREQFDMGQMATAGMVSAGLGFGVGMGLNSIASPQLLGYAGEKAKKGLNFVNNIMPDGSPNAPVSLKAQRGSAGVTDDLQKVADKYPDVPEEYVDEFYRSTPEDEMTPELFEDYLDAFDEGGSVPDGPPIITGGNQVNASFKLQELLGGAKDGSKITTVRQQIKAAVNKGLITPQEVKWSGIEDYLDMVDVNGAKLSRGEMLGVIENNTPKPKIVPVSKTQYKNYSLNTWRQSQQPGMDRIDPATAAMREEFAAIHGLPEPVLTGYDEHMLVIPGGTGAKVTDHFAEEQALTLSPNDTMIGHARIEAAELDGQPGKMVLEIQSDYHTEGQRHGYIGNKGDSFVGSQPIAGTLAPGARKGLYGYQHVLVAAADKNNIDPFAKNAMSQVWPFLDEGTKAKLRETTPALQPYGKDWDAMGMRLEIMDSINRGDEFIAFPASGDQISVIEQWGGTFEGESVIKRATTDRVKAMKKMGLTVEEVDMPQYKGMGDVINAEYDYNIEEDLVNLLHSRRQLLWYDSHHQTYMVTAYPNDADWDAARHVWDQNSGFMAGEEGEPLYDSMNEYARNKGDFLGAYEQGEEISYFAARELRKAGEEMSTVFNVIRLTDKVKERFRKEGMKMYSAAPVIGAAATKDKPKRERNPNGTFK